MQGVIVQQERGERQRVCGYRRGDAWQQDGFILLLSFCKLKDGIVYLFCKLKDHAIKVASTILPSILH
jgi:hypothetical protein